MNIILNISIHLDCETWALLVVGGIENYFFIIRKNVFDRNMCCQDFKITHLYEVGLDKAAADPVFMCMINFNPRLQWLVRNQAQESGYNPTKQLKSCKPF